MALDDVAHWQVELQRYPRGHNGWRVALKNLAGALYNRFLRDGQVGDLDDVIALHRTLLELGRVDKRSWSFLLHQLGFYIGIKYDKQAARTDLDEAISLTRAALQLRQPGQLGRANTMHNLADFLMKRFLKQAVLSDLDEATKLHRAALQLFPPNHASRPSSLSSLAFCLSNRYAHVGVAADLGEAIMLGRQVIQLHPPGHLYRGVCLYNLACDLRTRFLKQATMSDLNEAIELHRVALLLRPSGHPDRPLSFSGLALCLSNRYDSQGVIADLEEALTLGRAVLELRPPGHPHRGVCLYNLACDLRTRSLKQAAVSDLDEAIELHRAALQLFPPHHPNQPLSLCGLALCLSNKYDSLRVAVDLEEAITLSRQALELCPPRHHHRGFCLYQLACDLRTRFLKQTAVSDLDEAIRLHREALLHRPFGHPDRALSLSGLALCLSSKYDSQEVLVTKNLEEAIALGRGALELCPPGHAYRGVSLYNLACDLRRRFLKRAESPDLDEEIKLLYAASELHPPGHPDQLSSLGGSAPCLPDRYDHQGVIAKLEQTLELERAALELCPPGHPDRSTPLYNLANCLGKRSSLRLAAMPDLEEAIEMHRAALALRPTRHPNRASSLHDLALCLADRSHINAASTDLDEAIALEQEALQLLRRGDLAYDMSLDSLMTYLEMKTSPQVGIVIPGDPGVKQSAIQRDIRDVTFETLKTMPTRLLHTHTSILCNRDAQLSHFMSSREYNQLLSSVTACNPEERIECIRNAVLMYFQYVTLSHRWGEGEPSFHDIKGRPIYRMSAEGGLRKLQAFCLVACKRGYLWVWSDTCCIDKDSSAELQEAILSMFVWYRRSALTIVHLSDISDTGSLIGSEWLERGWTLQELLAPRAILFYTRNWSLYKNLASSNHKKEVFVIEELERETGIASRFLTDFHPGVDDVRSRLQWASLRRTTRPEDIAYSLFGIFNLHLPVFYGESAEYALGRLLAEIISQSGDVSVLDWVGKPSPFNSCFPAHITSYQAFSLPLHQHLDAEEHSLMMSREPTTLFAMQELHDLLAKSPLPRFLGRRLILQCIAHRVTEILLKGENQYAPSYTYELQASGLRPLEVTLSARLENSSIASPGSLQLVRPWNSRLLGPSARPSIPAEEQVLFMLARPFNAILVTELPYNEFKRIASSTLIVAQPVDSASILESEVRLFDIV
ncbi:hypothetical protein EDC04DRAFT_323750 [Pisolithus marmoratus]|nr:hypothetical protein EDC04DRAFT_323750 [Pisolithus marmoratus]